MPTTEELKKLFEQAIHESWSVTHLWQEVEKLLNKKSS